MSRITIKYPCGSNVNCKGISGQVTAIFIRGKGRAYEFSYVNNDGDPKSVNAEECELSIGKQGKLGF